MHRDTDFEIAAFKLQAPVVHEIVNVLYLCGVLGFHWMHPTAHINKYFIYKLHLAFTTNPDNTHSGDPTDM